MSDNKKNQEVDLLTLVNELPKEMEPKRDLWPGIEQAIAEKPQIKTPSNDSHWHNWARTAAAFVPAAFVLVFWLQQSSVTATNDQVFNSVTASFELQKRQLLRQVSNDTAVVENWQLSLADLEQAEQSLITALQSQPEDPALLKMLTQVYQQQLALIRKSHTSTLQPQFTQI